MPSGALSLLSPKFSTHCTFLWFDIGSFFNDGTTVNPFPWRLNGSHKLQNTFVTSSYGLWHEVDCRQNSLYRFILSCLLYAKLWLLILKDQLNIHIPEAIFMLLIGRRRFLLLSDSRQVSRIEYLMANIFNHPYWMGLSVENSFNSLKQCHIFGTIWLFASII